VLACWVIDSRRRSDTAVAVVDGGQSHRCGEPRQRAGPSRRLSETYQFESDTPMPPDYIVGVGVPDTPQSGARVEVLSLAHPGGAGSSCLRDPSRRPVLFPLLSPTGGRCAQGGGWTRGRSTPRREVRSGPKVPYGAILRALKPRPPDLFDRAASGILPLSLNGPTGAHECAQRQVRHGES